jgi:hypothetical protein
VFYRATTIIKEHATEMDFFSMFNIVAKISALFMITNQQLSLSQECPAVDFNATNNEFTPLAMPDLVWEPAADLFTQTIQTKLAAVNQYISQQVTCNLTAIAKANIDRVQLLSIDTVRDSFKYLQYINQQFKIPNGSGVENRYCNPHCDETMGGALGVNDLGIPTLKNITVNFDPGLLCTGAGYEPYLVASLKQAIEIARANSLQGKTTITVYSIGGTYNTLEKIALMRELTEIYNSFVVTVIGNNLGQYDNCQLRFFKDIPKLFIVGGTQDGDQLSRYSMVGDCVVYYAPAKYISPVTKKINEGVSFAGPIVAFLIANFKLNHPEANREQIDQHLVSLTDLIFRVSAQGQTVPMHVFRKDSVCNVGTLPPTPTPPPSPCPPSTLAIKDFIGTTRFKWFNNTINSCQDFCMTVEVFKNKANTQATLAFNNKDTAVTLSPTKLRISYLFNANRKVGTSLLSITGSQANQSKAIQVNGDIARIGFKGDRVSFKKIHNC